MLQLVIITALAAQSNSLNLPIPSTKIFQPETKDFNTQKYLIDIQHIKTEHGLANLTTTAICKDNQGFIWIAT
ncbi:MAG: two-component regulator propeller domain-containing protein, partial [Saprospiraceae bacterium]